jgi:CHASE1-domain containing sensor protein/two-component sensor histidine kinase
MRPSTWADRLVALLVRFVGLVILLATLVAAAASFLYNQAEDADLADRVAMQVNMRLRDHVAVLQGVRALYQSAPATHGPSIRAYIAALRPEERAPGMEGIGIAVAIRQGTPAAAEAMLRENYGREIKVWPATSQPVGFPIVLIEPYNPRRKNALGYDMYSEPVRREAMRRAWQTGAPAASGLVRLQQESGAAQKQSGFLVYLPIYAAEAAPVAGSTERPIEAFVYAPFRTTDLFTAVLGSQLATIRGVEIYAGDGPSAPLAFRHGTMGWDTHTEKLRVADRVWTMRISYGRQFERLGRPFGIFLFGLALALLATQLHRVQQRRVGAAQALAEQQARHAEDRELMIGEMAHRMKNALARISALARITLRESTSLQDFETRFDGRMRALSEAKQMIVTGAVSSVELGRIIRRELEVAGWPADRIAALDGPDVRLDDESAQAISLAVHEFVTNSVKYGALSGTGDLAVDWRQDGDAIELSWVETGLAETPHVESESFGTQFIRTLIERQLKGNWTRAAVDHGLSITLRWPVHAA